MEYTIIVADHSYDLPKKTITVMKELDAVLKVDSAKGLDIKQKFERLHNFMKNLVGEENTKEMFGSDRLDDIDLSELTLAVKKVVEAYDKPIDDYEAEKARRALDGIPIDKVLSMANAANKMALMPRAK